MKKIAVILSGCGVYDGAEIQEAVFSLLCIAQKGASYQCFAPDIQQHHVVNHSTGEEMKETRNVLVEAARIARGDIKSLALYKPEEFDGLIIPGGFGAAKNLTKWAFNGPDGEIDPHVQKAIVTTTTAKKPVAALCMGPAVVARAFKGSNVKPALTVGTTDEKSPYDIKAVSQGLTAAGSVAVMKSVREIQIDTENKIISAPCYMMEATIDAVYANTQQAINALFSFLK
ncbi:MAG: isoprenoid biosynthesis glyoxalase ElbB [Flavobacteriales bacterium]